MWRGLQAPLYFPVCVPAAAQPAAGSLVLAPEQEQLDFSPCEEEPV